MTDVVSVIVPTHNRRSEVAVAVAGVLAQRDVTVEVIVVDEASVDGTDRWLAALAAADQRVQVIRHDTPRKLPGARNAGIAAARGRWLAFLDDDDVWHPDKLTSQLRAMQETGARWSCSGAVHVDQALRPFFLVVPPPDVAARLVRGNVVPAGGSGVVVERALATRVGGFDESLIMGEDWEYWLRLAADGPPAVVTDTLVAYRVGGGSMSSDVDRLTRGFEQVGALHPEVPIADLLAGRPWKEYVGLQLARSGRRRASAKMLVSSGSVLLAAKAAWVLVAGRPWDRPRWSRQGAVRVGLRQADAWLEVARQRGALLSAEPTQPIRP